MYIIEEIDNYRDSIELVPILCVGEASVRYLLLIVIDGSKARIRLAETSEDDGFITSSQTMKGSELQ
jgi:hypothetical protein